MLSIPHNGPVDIAILFPDKKTEAQRSGATSHAADEHRSYDPNHI